MHTLVAAALLTKAYDRGEIEKELYDKKWEVPPCKIYLFKEKAEEVKEMVHALGQEDNEDYKMVDNIQFIIKPCCRKHHFMKHTEKFVIFSKRNTPSQEINFNAGDQNHHQNEKIHTCVGNQHW